jgi:hypothetical protein
MIIGDLAADAERRASVPERSVPEPSDDSWVGAAEALLILRGGISGGAASRGDSAHDACGLKRRRESYFMAWSHERAPTGLTTSRMDIKMDEEHVEENGRASKRRYTSVGWGC